MLMGVSPSGTSGTAMLNWYKPTYPGESPEYDTDAGVDPNEILSEFARVLRSFTITPGGMIEPSEFFFASPNPMPYVVISSPGFAGRNGTPAIRLGFPT